MDEISSDLKQTSLWIFIGGCPLFKKESESFHGCLKNLEINRMNFVIDSLDDHKGLKVNLF